MAIVPARKTRVPDLSPVRRKQLQKSAGSILASNKLARSALEKGGGTSERRPRRRGVWHASVRDHVARRRWLVRRPSPNNEVKDRR